MQYLPSFTDNSCITADYLNNGYIRVYDSTPSPNTTINYTDYFLDYNYLERTGSQSFGNYYTSINCLDHNDFSNDEIYRLDYVNVLIMFTIMSFFIILVPFKIFSKLWKKGSL